MITDLPRIDVFNDSPYVFMIKKYVEIGIRIQKLDTKSLQF